MSKERHGFSHEIKRLVRERQDNTCLLCGWIGDLSVHHCIPQSEGGLNTPENAAGLCRNYKDPDCPNCHDSVDYLTLEHNIPFEKIMEEGLEYWLDMYPKE